MLHAWNTFYKTRPYAANMLSSSVLHFGGDVLAQRRERTRHCEAKKTAPPRGGGGTAAAKGDDTPHPPQHHMPGSAPAPGASASKSSTPRTVVTSSSSAAPAALSSRYHSECYDVRRSVILSIMGCAFAPFMVRMTKFTDRFFPTKSYLNAAKQGFCIWALVAAVNPFLITYITVANNAWIHGIHDRQQLQDRVVERLQRNYIFHNAVGLCFWSTFAWLPMFYYLPVYQLSHFRVLYSSCLSLIWSSVASYIQHRGEATHQQQGDLEEPENGT